jgi:hypothetical protein
MTPEKEKLLVITNNRDGHGNLYSTYHRIHEIYETSKYITILYKNVTEIIKKQI